MNGKYLAVCLLALAGSVSIYSAVLACSGAAPSPPAAIHQIIQDPKPLVRGVSASPPRLGATKSVSEARAASLVDQMAFEPNVGQANPSAEFVARGKGMTVLLVRDGFQIEIPQRAGLKSKSDDRAGGRLQQSVVGVHLVQSSGLSWTGEGTLRGETNYFVGRDPRKWRTHVPRFARARAVSSPEEPSLEVYPSQEGFEYDLRVPPNIELAGLRLALTRNDPRPIG